MNPRWRKTLLPLGLMGALAPVAMSLPAGAQSERLTPHAAVMAPPPAGLPPALLPLSKEGYTPQHFGREGGLDIWWITAPDGPRPIYTSLDGRFLITGMVYDSENAEPGTLGSATARHVTAIRQALSGVVPELAPASRAEAAVAVRTTSPTPVPVPSSALPAQASRGDALMQALDQAKWSELGAPDAPLIYMVVDPTCHFSIQAWQALQEPIAEGRVRVRLIVTNALGDAATPIAAGLLSLPSPAAGWTAYNSGGALPADPLPGANALAVNETTRRTYQSQFGVSGVPWFVYRSATGRVRHYVGAPPTPDTILSELPGRTSR